jgi:alanine racemase
MTAPIRAVVETAALRHNLGVVRRQAPHARVLAVVKANAYGHGSVVAAKALADADAFAVARLEEGVQLREAGLAHPIVLLEGVFDADQLALAARHDFALVVHSREQLSLLLSWRGAHRFRTWIKLDSGMHRLGFSPDEFPDAYAAMTSSGLLTGAPVLMTHLANADRMDDSMTANQLRVFARMVGGLPGERSIANTAAIFGWPEAQGDEGDWIRPGLALYGASPFAERSAASLGLRPAMTLLSQVIAVKDVPAGGTVGYGAAWRAERPTRLAVVAAGYADGYPRNTSMGCPVLVNGRDAAVVGRVSMDMLTVDVTDHSAVAPGDPVVLWGEGIPVETVASAAGTISWELLCGVSQRVAHDPR